MTRFLKTVCALFLCAALMLCAASCGLISLRSAEAESEPGSGAYDLSVPETFAEEETEAPPPVSETPPLDEVVMPGDEKTGVEFVFAGDLLVDSHILANAARQASEEQSYSFLRLFAGVRQTFSSADQTVGFGSSILRPRGDEDPAHVIPEEFLTTLEDIGYDALDTFEPQPKDARFENHGILTFPDEGAPCVRTEANGITYTLFSVGSEEYPVAAGKTLERIESEAENAALLIVLVDWEPGSGYAEQCAAAYYMAEAGADAVIGAGDTLGRVEWLTTDDGTKTLVAYSLGNLLATGSTPEELCGAILRFKADRAEDGSVNLKNVILTPTLTHFGVNKDGYQIFPLSGYGDELAGEHAVSGVTTGGLKSFVRSIVPAEFLPYDYRG